MGPLKSSRHEKFARAIASGLNSRKSYVRVYGNKENAVADAAASRLLRNVRVSARIAELKQKSSTEFTLTMKERREFLARSVRCKLDTIDLGEDGDLIQEIIREDTAEGERVKIKLSDKLACIMADAKLAGELIEKTDLTTNGQGLPSQIFITFGPHWDKPRTE